MESQRQLKFSRLIQKELSEIFQMDTKHLFGGAWITVTMVRISPDLSVAKVYLSLSFNKDKEAVLTAINTENKAIRKLLGERIGKQVRIIPALNFFHDDTIEYASKMDKLISGLDIPPEEKDEENEKKDE